MSWRAKFQRFSPKLTLEIIFFEQIGLGSLTRQNHICWAIEASKLQIAFGSLLAAWVKKRLPSWYETQIADEDNCGLSVSPLLPPLSIEGDTVLAVVLHFTEQQQRRRKTQTQDSPAQNMHPCLPGRDTFCRIQFRQFSNSQMRKAYKRGSGAISWVVKLRRNQLSSDTRLFFASFHWATNKMRFHFLRFIAANNKVHLFWHLRVSSTRAKKLNYYLNLVLSSWKLRGSWELFKSIFRFSHI